jgi:arylsulfatase A-like enzyme
MPITGKPPFMADASTQRDSFQPRHLLMLALWCGLLVGAVDSFLAADAQGGIACRKSLTSVGAPLTADVGALLLLAGVLLIPRSYLQPARWMAWSTGILGAVASYGVISQFPLRQRSAIVLAIGLGTVLSRVSLRSPQRAVRWLRRSMLPVAGLSLAAVAWPAVMVLRSMPPLRPVAAENQPNILLIVLDTLRADRVGAYGYQRPTTPFLDELAQQTLLFENAFANSSWTLPSHVSMLTGRLPSAHRAELQTYDGRFKTLQEYLGQRGYFTAAISANAAYASCHSGVTAGFHQARTPFPPAAFFLAGVYLRKLEKLIPALGRLIPSEIPGSLIVQEFSELMQSRPRRPAFVLVNLMDVHEPNRAPADMQARFARRGRTSDSQPWDPARMEDCPPSPEFIELTSDLYDASVAEADRQLRELFHALPGLGLDENLLVIITSDHGESLGEHELQGHRNSLYLEQLRVPLLIKFPEGKEAGQRNSTLVTLRQIPATIAHLLGDQTVPFRGTPLLPSVLASLPPNRAIFAELSGGPWPGVALCWPIHQGGIRSMITPQWHLLAQDNGEVELYSWPADLRERRNLAQDPAYRQTVADLLQQLNERLPRPEGGAVSGPH